MKNQLTLLIPEKTDIEFEQIFSAFTKAGGKIKRLGKFWIRDEELASQKIAIYGNQAFSFVLAQIYNVGLLSPDDALVTRLEKKWTKRDIRLKQIKDITEKDFPVFIKSVIPKLFIASVFQTIADFNLATEGIPDTEAIMASGIINNIQAEARSFIMDGVVKDIALYEGHADLISGNKFVEAFIHQHKNDLPGVVVIDIAYCENAGWFVLEFNACWGAGLNNCKAENVIDCIIRATIND